MTHKNPCATGLGRFPQGSTEGRTVLIPLRIRSISTPQSRDGQRNAPCVAGLNPFENQVYFHDTAFSWTSGGNTLSTS